MLKEFSPDTPKGSVSQDLNASKLWLCRKLQEFDLDHFDQVYILGSWYGSMGLWLLHQHISFEQAYNVDWDSEKTAWVAHMLKRAHLNNRMQAVRADANDILYKGDSILVVNTSTNDITGRDWLEHIPSGSVVALQGRDNQADSNGVDTVERFDRAYPLSETLYLGHLVLTGTENDVYTRFMKIGIK